MTVVSVTYYGTDDTRSDKNVEGCICSNVREDELEPPSAIV